jgi:hypothetical protein
MIDPPAGTVVIGGSQAGLAVGYFLEKRGLPFVLVDENERIDDAWRKRWDSLRLFAPDRYNGLQGIVESCQGLYFIGLLFLYSLRSALIGGGGSECRAHRRPIVSTRLARNADIAGGARTAGRQCA